MEQPNSPQSNLEVFTYLVERLDAWAIAFSQAYSPKIDDYILASDEERKSMPYPLPKKKTRVMLRICRILLNLWKAKQAGNLPASVRIVFMEGGPIPEHYRELVSISNAALTDIRRDAKAVKSCIKITKTRIRQRSRGE